ncbi:hypothetical protein ACIQMV_20890 [Streptomyces sp. NPDC091412]|uniref:hypothetical protein n=1 Tax=Streptomyces sp. NPDC091412 TaxID=3366002 RepID=UPI00380F5441
MPGFEITPIGTVRNNRTDVQYTDNWGAVRSTITIDEEFRPVNIKQPAWVSRLMSEYFQP